MNESTHPLLDEIDQRNRLDALRRRACARRCEAMERALVETGFAKGTSYWSVAMLITRISSDWEPLQRSLDDLASDKAIATTTNCLASRKRIVRRALHELASYGLIRFEITDGAKRRRTRRESNLWIELNRAGIEGKESLENWSRDADNAADTQADKTRTTQETAERTTDGQRGGQPTVLSLYLPLDAQEPVSPSPSETKPEAKPDAKPQTKTETTTTEVFDSVFKPLKDAGVERVRALINESKRCGVSPDELADAAYVVAYTPGLTGGAIFDYVRSGGWPVSGVRSAEHIRNERATRSHAIRKSVAADAARSGKAIPDWYIAAVIARRLIERELDEFVTADERHALHRLELKESRSAV
ncbi:hypothetical protein [Rhodopirellula sp. SWK7]|uniref:hypothetical protein n=1 Tax=Rhodopirellula sp. SWK7 TaxID=595460 RepID=UPI0002BEE1FF|nr:hypothetical protein [Rhodopirellula sp. SWK7]EMI41690.1 hypothetical protein RRSWK_05787 [Rhodopirellula sp. SWK7]